MSPCQPPSVHAGVGLLPKFSIPIAKHE
uniref:Uncharacterized protein n=1 Tax=Arundo donax TaxID=35708 RepID=A0A0A9A700_ARUDO